MELYKWIFTRIGSKIKTPFSFSLSQARFKLSVSRLIKLAFALVIIISIAYQLSQSQQDDLNSEFYLAAPKVNDLYFLNFRLMSDKLRPNEKYRMAKVVDITGDVITLVYGSFFYLRQQAVEDAIHFGQLRYPDYFESKRYDFKLTQLPQLWDSGAIYMAKRAELNKLFGNYITPDTPRARNEFFISGRSQNLSGMAYLNAGHLEDNLQQAIDFFQQSAQYGYAQGQVNLAEMYLNGQHKEVNSEIDKQQALYWFKQAALQSHKPGVLKYVIVCKQVASCSLADFYQALTTAGVNIKVRSFDFKLSPNS